MPESDQQDNVNELFTAFVADPSFLSLFFHYNLNTDGIRGLHIFIPDTLVRLIDSARADPHHADIFLAFINYFLNRKISASSEDWSRFFTNYATVKKAEVLMPLETSPDDDELLLASMGWFINPRFNILLSPKTNMLGDVIGKILAFSKRTGTPVIMRTRRLVHIVSSRVNILEFALQSDAFVGKKQSFFQRLFNFPGGKTLKFLIGVVLAAGIPVPFNLAASRLLFKIFDP